MLNKKMVSFFVLVAVAAFSFLQVRGQSESFAGAPSKQTQLFEQQKNLVTEPTEVKKGQVASVLPTYGQVLAPESVSSEIATPPLSYIDSIKARAEKNSFHEGLLKDHEQQKKYPPYNQRIPTIEQDPVERRYEIDERTTQNEEGDNHLTIWTDQKYYLSGDEVVISAILQDARGVRLPTTFFGQLIYNETQSLQQFEFLDPDQDGVYEYRLRLDQSQTPALLAGVYKVLIVNNTNEMVDAASFTLSQPDVQLTGEYKDVISPNGDLIIQAEVNVTSKNQLYFQATLYSSTNDPIGSTQVSGELMPGRHWVSLKFDGLMIRDVGEPGPYLLKSLSLAKVAFPIQRAPLIYPEFYTQGYSVDQFRNTNFAETASVP